MFSEGMSRQPSSVPAGLIETARRQAGLLNARQFEAYGLDWDRRKVLIDSGALVQVRPRVVLLLAAQPRAVNRSEELDLCRVQTALLGPLACGPTAVVTGIPALVLAGVQGAPQRFVPEVTLRCGGPCLPRDGVRVRRTPVKESVLCFGVPCVLPQVALAQAVCEVSHLTGVALMDSARNRQIIGENDFIAARRLTFRKRGSVNAKAWWAESDPRADSPAETVARITCTDLGFPPDMLQLKVFDRNGAWVGRIDLAWRLPDGSWLLGEVDGVDWHNERRQVERDLNRQNALLSPITTIRRWTGGAAFKGRLADEVAEILSASGWKPGCPAPSRLYLP